MRFSSVLVIFATAFAYVNAVPVVSRQGAGDLGCPAQDDNGTSLDGTRDPTADDDNAGGLVCRYTGAGSCRFFADGTFSSGASACPQGLVAGGTKSGAGGADAAPSSAAATPSAEPSASPDPAPAPATSSTPAAVTPSTSTSIVAVTPSTSSSAVVATPSSSKPAVATTSSSSSASATASTPAQGNAALPSVQQRPVMLVTIFGIAAGALMAL